jgi:hypothetical protein
MGDATQERESIPFASVHGWKRKAGAILARFWEQPIGMALLQKSAW